MISESDKVRLTLNGKEIEAYWLGSGCVSTAYAIADKRCKGGYKVLVVSAIVDYTKEGLSRIKHNCKYLPQVKKAGIVWDGTRYKFAYFMPMYHTIYSQKNTHSSRQVYEVVQQAVDWRSDLQHTPEGCKQQIASTSLPECIKNAFYILIDAMVPVYIENGCQGWRGWDLHGGNAMLDNNGNLVLIDVIYTGGKRCPQKWGWK